MPKLSPSTINHLHDAVVIKCLGKGGFGEVKLYKCKEKEIQKNGDIIECSKCFVVKHMILGQNKKWNLFKDEDENESNLKKNKIKKALLNEYTIGIILNNNINIRETIDIDLIDNSIIFEYCGGCDFYNYMTSSKKIKTDLIIYFKQIVNAIEYMHSKNIAHRDLKLENIMIDYNTKTIKIIDFGDACVCNINGNKINSNGIRGSTPYIAPEEFDKIEYDGLKVDIWSLGIILYEIIYTKVPWLIANDSDDKFKRFKIVFKLDFLDYFLPNMDKTSMLHKCFKMLLNPNPDLRNNIQEIKSVLNEIIVIN